VPTEEVIQVPTDQPPVMIDDKKPTKEFGSVTTESYVDEDDDDSGFDEEDDDDEDDDDVVDFDEDEFKEYREEVAEKIDEPKPTHEQPKVDKKKVSRSPFAFNAVMGLSCGVLVIMLFLVVAMVVRRRRITRTRVILAENNDDREHLVKMQNNGFENPTYKFFYY